MSALEKKERRALSLVLQQEVEGLVSQGQREVLTPEGVCIYIDIAPMSLRAVAFFIDLFLILMLCLAFAIGGWSLGELVGGSSSGVFGAMMLVALFLVRTFYFMGFEIAWRGRTPGKKMVGLRVVDASGGHLSPGAVMVRNLTREVELFLPIIALFAPEAIVPGHSHVVVLFALGWTFILTAMPWLNRDRMRVGDLAASTLVIKAPRARLLDAVTAASRGQQASAQRVFTFGVEQLDMYGIYEMEVLEDFLRQHPSRDSMEAVAEKVARKIAWAGREWRGAHVRTFLEDFYDALKMRREQQLLFGKRQEAKKEGTLGQPPL